MSYIVTASILQSDELMLFPLPVVMPLIELSLLIYLIFTFCFCFQQYDWLIGAQYKPMELLKSEWATIRKSPAWAVDSWGLG